MYTLWRGLALLVILALVAFILAGCVSGGTMVNRAQASQFHVGVTTPQDVEAAMGVPQTVQDLPTGTLLVYSGMQARVKAASFVPIVGLFAGGTHVETSTVTFEFGTDGLLKHVSTSKYSADSRMGSVQ